MKRKYKKLLSKADICRDKGDWSGAITYYEKSLEIDPDRRDIWVQLGHALKEANFPEKALEAYRSACALPGNDGDAPLHFGLLAQRMNKPVLAMAGRRQLLQENPDHPDADHIYSYERMLEEAHTCRDEGDWSGAITHYEKSLEINPDRRDIWVQLGHALKEANFPEKALEAYRSACDLSGNDGDAPLHFGLLAQRMNKPVLAMAGRRQLLQENPDHPDADHIYSYERMLEEAHTCRDEGDWSGAITHYEKSLEIDPDRRDIWVQLGHALKEAGFLDKALAVYRHASTLPGNDGDAPLHLGLLAQRMANIPLALTGLNQALQEKPDHPDALRELDNIKHATQGPRHIIVKEPGQILKRDVAILITHVPAGRLKPHVLPYMKQLRDAGLLVILVVIVDRPVEFTEEESAVANGIIVRDNAGYDFGAWQHAFQLYPDLFGANFLIITNDSVIPTLESDVFQRMIDRIRSCPTDIAGLTASHEYGWHIQSYFLGFKPKALCSLVFNDFIRNIERIDDKDTVIRIYEIPFAKIMQAGGLTIRAIYTSPVSANPTIFGWKELIDQGFPFIKLLMLRKEFAASTGHKKFLRKLQKSWPAVLQKTGFDINLVRASLLAGELSDLPVGAERGLLVDRQPYTVILPDHRLRVACLGPWNYEGRIGATSRELLCTLRRADIQLNAYPIARPYHDHQQICPAIETIDFHTQPDIALIQFDSLCAEMLTDAQHAVIASAKQRIGYWTTEMDSLPPAWHKQCKGMDRIWVSSPRCAALLAGKVSVPVEVVPRAVYMPASIVSQRQTILQRSRIDPDSHIIFGVVDMGDRLARENTAALLDAFARSGLAQENWTLVLVHRGAHTEPEAEKNLSALMTRTTGVHVLEGHVDDNEAGSLFNISDIYVSLHSALDARQIAAEAMAMGKSVIAPDSTDIAEFLDKSCGYPVASAQEMGTASTDRTAPGHPGGRMDEAAMAGALVKAAGAVANRNPAIGTAARERISRLFSADTIAHTIMARLSDVAASTQPDRTMLPHKRRPMTHLPQPPQVNPTFASAQEFDAFVPADGVMPVRLAHDLSWNEKPLPEGAADDWLFFAPHNAYVSPDVVSLLLDAAERRPDVVLFYADDIAAEEDMLDRIRLKPDFDRTLLAAQDYIGAPVFIRRHTLLEVGGLDSRHGTAVLYDLVLRVAEAGKTISRIPHVLVGYKGQRPVADTQARCIALSAQVSGDGIEFAPGNSAGLLSQQRRFTDDACPSVSIVIPTCRSRVSGSDKTYVEHLLAGIAQARWPMDRVTVIVGDDVAGEPDWAKREWPFAFRRVETVRPPGTCFNYAAKMNRLWRSASDEYIIFLNDDANPLTPDWIRAMLGFACDKTVGGVGARLYYEDGSLQHAGIFPAFGAVVHAWLNWPAGAKTYQDWAMAQREWSMVTGAVFATRRTVLERINGFDERFSLEFNDIDLCLRIRNLGYRLVYNPDAVFTHAEKISRGETIPPGEERALFLSRWSRWLENDPASHPRFARGRLDLVAEPEARAWYA
ncbi:tetratricopeptide repeat protein [Komagataeibacter rhaeticus]|uniref:Tetratricopeptide repeat protein n=1 Tax=Komagataeibacter rhaeticus TaxID=215221 RepID=A0A7H4IL63_9PROT|nr:tetratricopeptide repeat protein [Komagataeibacter rhaeticus]QOC46511.1 tetratricopeptide repeat protein [Komagataeibacter rhaeticus]QOC46647.1 tetratricopeptide repeat protein [Komagataeibacter rhaeticus]